VFDIGFTELLVVAVVGLIVIGPARLPETVRALALWIGRLKRMTTKLYQEVEREVGMDDIRRQLHNERILEQLQEKDDSRRETSTEAEKEKSPDAPQ
jgi:sec-independent protein translocase protein TatB